MSDRLRLGVLGAGAIGAYVAGRVAAAGAAEVVLVGRARQAGAFARGLTVQEFDRAAVTAPPERFTFASDPAALAGCAVVLVAVKSQHTEDAARSIAGAIAPDAIVVSLQNGVRNPDTLRAALPGRRVVPSIVTWNVIAVGDVYRRATSGPLMLERVDAPAMRALVDAVRAGGIPVEEHADLAPHQWTKLLVNLNNAISALTDVSTATLLVDPGYRRVIADLADEGLAVLRAAKLRPARFHGVPLALMPKILRLPTPLVRVALRAQLRVDPSARSSMWQDLASGRPTEVDHLNGELVRVAEAHGTDAPRNRRIVALVREAEAAGRSPRLSAANLRAALER